MHKTCIKLAYYITKTFKPIYRQFCGNHRANLRSLFFIIIKWAVSPLYLSWILVVSFQQVLDSLPHVSMNLVTSWSIHSHTLCLKAHYLWFGHWWLRISRWASHHILINRLQFPVFMGRAIPAYNKIQEFSWTTISLKARALHHFLVRIIKG
jgi:hypothetical protein